MFSRLQSQNFVLSAVTSPRTESLRVLNGWRHLISPACTNRHPTQRCLFLCVEKCIDRVLDNSFNKDNIVHYTVYSNTFDAVSYVTCISQTGLAVPCKYLPCPLVDLEFVWSVHAFASRESTILCRSGGADRRKKKLFGCGCRKKNEKTTVTVLLACRHSCIGPRPRVGLGHREVWWVAQHSLNRSDKLCR